MYKVVIDWARIERAGGVDSQATLRQMIIQIARKDKTALKFIYQKFGGKILAIIRSVGVNDVASEDVLVNVFERIWRQAPAFDAAGASPGQWVLTIVRTCVSERLAPAPLRKPADAEGMNAFPTIAGAPNTLRTAKNSISLDCADPGVLGNVLSQETASA